MYELAVLYKEQARYDAAEPLLLEVLEGRRLKLGDTHPHTLQSLNNLIDLYEAWDKPEKGQPVASDAITLYPENVTMISSKKQLDDAQRNKMSE
ncbi:tetratricopeptide repeat protein [Planctomycetota bacterium]